MRLLSRGVDLLDLTRKDIAVKHRFNPRVPVCCFLSVATCILIGCVPSQDKATGRSGTTTNTTTSTTTDVVVEDEATGTEAADSPTASGRLSEPEDLARSSPAAAGDTGLPLIPLSLELPAPAFQGTPVPVSEPNVEKPRNGPRPPLLAPEGTKNLALGAPVRCSDPQPVAGEIDLVTDGFKEASDFGYLELQPGTQWVQIDLGSSATVFGVLVWHNHAVARVYRDVVVQISDDPDFLEATTVFNNDHDNSSGLGVGRDMGYVETSEGKLIDCRGYQGRYLRLYSRGNHLDPKNHYTEVEVYGLKFGANHQPGKVS